MINISQPIRLSQIAIHNYKGIDDLQMEFPQPQMPEDPDVLVMGSQNGLGKTSILECCSLLLLALTLRKKQFMLDERYSSINVPDLLIKAGASSASIRGDIAIDDQKITLQIKINRNGCVDIQRDQSSKMIIPRELNNAETETDDLIDAICGLTPNPVIENSFLLFHSYRKVQEGHPELGMMVDRGRSSRRPLFMRYDFPVSAFKVRILRALMVRANLFESVVADKEPDETIKKLNELVQFYAGGEIHKLRPAADNTVDFRVMPSGGGDSFTFDGLSSGQKEIISTLFLIWHHTKNFPSVVFIDEPELHLNGQWHRSFVKNLVNLAPKNQYIIATHSVDVMSSVNADHRILLYNDQEETNA